MRATIGELPKAHYDCAKALFRFLYDFSQFSEGTAMSSANISIVIGPNILRRPPSTETMGGGLSDTPAILKVSLLCTVVSVNNIFFEQSCALCTPCVIFFLNCCLLDDTTID
jgi:hypothetical protein